MNKILLEIYVPSIEKKYEIFVPVNKGVARITQIINKSISELSDNAFPIQNDFRIYNQQNGEPLNMAVTIKQAGLKNGSKILFV